MSFATLLVFACGDEPRTPTDPSPGSGPALAIVSGDQQAAPAGSLLPVPLTVRVTGRNGKPDPTAAVAFRLPEPGSGQFTNGGQRVVVSPDANGLATAFWQLGPTAGTHRATAAIAADTSISVRFTATTTAGPASRVSWNVPRYFTLLTPGVYPDPYREAVGATAYDNNGNRAPGARVYFRAIEMEPMGGVPQVSPDSAATDSQGAAGTTIGADSNNPFGVAGLFAFEVRVPGGRPDTLARITAGQGLKTRAVAAGGYHTCAIAQDRQIRCWGDNAHGQLGDGTLTGHRLAKRTTSAELFTNITTGWFHSCAVATTGVALCWGANDAGQGGVGPGPSTVLSPTPVAGNHSFVALAAGERHTCGIDTTGQAWCWGDNTKGQLGNGATGGSAATPQAVATAARFTELSVGASTTCGITNTAATLCWGDNASGQADPAQSAVFVTRPAQQDGPYRHVATTAEATCATRDDRRVICWGGGLDGQHLIDSPPLAQLAGGPPQGFTSSNGDFCGIDDNGKAWCWGTCVFDNRTYACDPQFGRAEPLALPFAVGQLTLGSHHHCITDRATTMLHCWGENPSGELGLGPVGTMLTPSLVGDLFPMTVP